MRIKDRMKEMSSRPVTSFFYNGEKEKDQLSPSVLVRGMSSVGNPSGTGSYRALNRRDNCPRKISCNCNNLNLSR